MNFSVPIQIWRTTAEDEKNYFFDHDEEQSITQFVVGHETSFMSGVYRVVDGQLFRIGCGSFSVGETVIIS